MKTQIQQKITENLWYLDSFQLSEVLNFTEFMRYRKNIFPDPDKIDSLCGKYRNYMSDSNEFAQIKQEEIKTEENRSLHYGK